MIYVRKLMDDSDLADIQSMIREAVWVDGLLTTNNSSKEIKCNMEVSTEYMNYQAMSDLVYKSLDMDPHFLKKTSAKTTGVPIFSKTDEGGYYKPHQDSFNLGHYSTTVFLNDPDEYEGGYLRIYDDDIKEYKLEAGHAITYSTGMPHEVSEVISGQRNVSVMWTHSHFPPDYRGIVNNQIQDLLNILASHSESFPMGVEDAIKDPLFIAEMLKGNFQRIFMDK